SGALGFHGHARELPRARNARASARARIETPPRRAGHAQDRGNARAAARAGKQQRRGQRDGDV
ncbi:MAG: hypothetical protein ACK54C_11445, partial [Betaproteobacteria bacterium]